VHLINVGLQLTIHLKELTMMQLRLAPLVFLVFSQLLSAAPNASAFEPVISVENVSENPPQTYSEQTSASVYPAKAAQNQVSGYVVVEFTVTPFGGTDNIQIVDAQPKGVFEESAIRAVKHFKYKMKVVDGVPVEIPGVVKKLIFGTNP
jgi:TonB family protein